MSSPKKPSKIKVLSYPEPNLNKRRRGSIPEAGQYFHRSRSFNHEHPFESKRGSAVRFKTLSSSRNSPKSRFKSIFSTSGSIESDVSNFVPKVPSSAAYINGVAQAEKFRISGNDMYHQKNFNEAVRLYTRAIQAYPANCPPYQEATPGFATSLANRASAYMALEQFTLATTDLLQSLRCTHLPIWLSDSSRLTLGKRVLRLVKCHLALSKPIKATEAIEHLSEPTSQTYIDPFHPLYPEMVSLLSKIKQSEESLGHHRAITITKNAWSRIQNNHLKASGQDPSKFYAILGVSHTFTAYQLKQSYRALCRRLHPDKGGAVNVFQHLQEAFEILSDPTKRSTYDSGRSQQHQSIHNPDDHVQNKLLLGGGQARATSITTTKEPTSDIKIPFDKLRDDFAESLIERLNKEVFGNKLPAEIDLMWSNRLDTTAGKAKWSVFRDSQTGVILREKVVIELGTKVVDSESRLMNILAQELCHVATWIIDGQKEEKHGKNFKAWARKIHRVIPQIEVTTKHTYEINYKFKWKCSADDCPRTYGRHSNSIKPDKHMCECGRDLIPVPRIREEE